MAYHAIENGAAGVDMGRNIFQSDTPAAMIRAVGAVVHESAKPEDAYEQYLKTPEKEQELWPTHPPPHPAAGSRPT
jgi:pyridoxal biosynthesis lyase PdxS